MSRYQGNYEYDPQGYNPKADMPTMDLTTLSASSLRAIEDANEARKARAAMDISAIVNRSMVSMVGLMCQDALEKRVEIMCQINPAAERNLRALATTNMLYIRNRIDNPNKNNRR